MAKQGFLHYTTPTGSTTLAPEVLGDTCAPTLALAGQQLKMWFNTNLFKIVSATVKKESQIAND